MNVMRASVSRIQMPSFAVSTMPRNFSSLLRSSPSIRLCSVTSRCVPQARTRLPVLDEANQAIQEDFGITVAIELVRFHRIQAVAAPDEVPEEFDVVRVGLREQVAEPRADDLRRGRKPIHPGHGVVTLGEIAKAVHIRRSAHLPAGRL